MARRHQDTSNSDQGQRSTSSTADSGPQRKKTRGPTTLPWLFVKKPETPKLPLIWDMWDNPVGPDQNATRFSDSIGSLLRQSRRFKWSISWGKNDNESKDWLWRELKNVWELEDGRKDPTIKIAGKIFRDNKSKFKKIHDEREPDNDLDKIRPDGLSPNEWNGLIQLWNKPEYQELCERNKVNRSKQRVKHTTGRRSHARVIHEMTEEEGTPPYLGDFFVKSHTRANTQDAIDEVSREHIEQMRKLAGTDEEGKQKPLTDDIYRQVMPPERRGRGRVTQNRFFGSKSSSSHGYTSTQIMEMQQELAEMKREAKERQSREEEMERHDKAREVEMERRDKAREEEIQVMRTQQGQLAMMLQAMFNPGQHEQFSKMLQAMVGLHQPSSESIAKKQGEIQADPPRNSTLSSPYSGNDFYLQKPCKLLYGGAKEVVAHGQIHGVDPSSVVHGKTMGKGNFQIRLTKVVEPSCFLLMPNSFSQTLGEVDVGGFVVWPQNMLELMM